MRAITGEGMVRGEVDHRLADLVHVPGAPIEAKSALLQTDGELDAALVRAEDREELAHPGFFQRIAGALVDQLERARHAARRAA